jgi:hypothetical protein
MALSPFAEALDKQAESSLGERPAFRGVVLLRDRYQIDPANPLPGLDQASAKAYAVSDRMETGRNLFALICTPGLPPRVNVMAAVKGIAIRGHQTLVDAGNVEWPLLGQRCMAVVYEMPLGGRFTDTPSSTGSRISELDMLRRFIRPACVALKQFAQRQITHRAIRPNNLYFVDKDQQMLALGDCATAPAGFDQPAVFETIERAMASPGGRGEGTPADDMYALGVTILFTLLGRNPVADMSDTDLITSKIERGSYATLTTDQPIPLTLLEPLRGLLSDTEEERWTVADLETWIEGKRAPSHQRKPIQKAEVPLTFDGRDYFNLRVVAAAMTQSRSLAGDLIREGHLDAWLRKIPTEAGLADAIAATLSDVKFKEGDGPPQNDFLVAKVAILLDPLAPIRYKDLAFQPDAYGPAIAVEVLRKGNALVAKEAVLQRLQQVWFIAQKSDFKPRNIGMEKRYEEIEAILLDDRMGYGMERVMYELNPSLACQSPILLREYVATIHDLLPALDEVSKRADNKTRPMDRHIAAFIGARSTQDVIPHLAALADHDEKKATIGMLSLLALLQWRLETGPQFGLASWIGGLLGPAIETYHSRATRMQLEKDIPRLVRRGSLPDMFEVIDNAERRRHDAEGFAIANAQYAAAQAEINQIESSDTAKTESAELLSQQWAAMCCIIGAMMAIMILFLAETL